MGILAAQHYGTSCGLVNLGKKVEYGSLARTVRTDESAYLRCADSYVEFINGYKASEINSQMSCLKNQKQF